MRKILNQTVILNILIICPQKYVKYITVQNYKTQTALSEKLFE